MLVVESKYPPKKKRFVGGEIPGVYPVQRRHMVADSTKESSDGN